MLEIALAVVFLGAGSYAVRAVWRKVPLLLQVPLPLIEESFATRPPLLKERVGPVYEFFRERRYVELYYRTLVRTLHWVRLTLLRLERLVFRALESIEARDRNLSEAEHRYWNELRHWKHEVKANGNGHIPDAVLTESAPPELTSAGSRES